MGFEPILTRNVGVRDVQQLKVYESRGGYASVKKAFEQTPEEIVQIVKESGLRGRGGAGFSCGMKWGFLPKDHQGPIYMVVNFDESEPGTFKDRYLCDHDPHQILEGTLVSCYATRASVAYIFIRGLWAGCAN